MNPPAVSLDDVLDALELPQGDPGIGFLQRLFQRFNERVPFESASKIVRAATAREPADRLRRPETFWAEHVRDGTGGTCFARVAAFDWLISRLGFESRRVLGSVEIPGDHAALLVSFDDEEWVCDVGFPLPALFAARPGEVETALATLEITGTDRGLRVRFRGGVPLGPREVEIFSSRAEPEAFEERWRQTFRPDSRFLGSVYVRKPFENRVLSFARGELRVDDRHSRTRIPLAAPRSRPISDAFGIDAALLQRAFSIAGDPDPELGDPRIDVYLETSASAETAFAAIGSARAYERLMREVAGVSLLEASATAWRVRLSPTGEGSEGSIEEEVTADSAARRLLVRRATREFWLAVEVHDGRTHLVRGAPLPFAPEELLRNDSLRGRIAGTLAVDLLAWARILQSVGRRT